MYRAAHARASRAQGKDTQSMRSLTGKYNYQPSERALKADFTDPATGQIDHYTAKVYEKGDIFFREGGQKHFYEATEVTSMGLQHMASNPLGLMQKDPKLFDFIFDEVMNWTP